MKIAKTVGAVVTSLGIVVGLSGLAGATSGTIGTTGPTIEQPVRPTISIVRY